MKLIPGVRLNFGKDSVGMSFGIPGLRYTMNSKGRRTFSAGIPGTGISDVTVLSSGRRSSRARTPEVAPVPARVSAPEPGFFASQAELSLIHI